MTGQERPIVRLPIRVPRLVHVVGKRVSRADFFSWLWARFQESGLLGIHEGTFTAEQAESSGLKTESWTVDSAEAPRERDWVGDQDELEAELYFQERSQAEKAVLELARIPELTGLGPEDIKDQEAVDWVENWKKGFHGLTVPPFWKVLPPWIDEKVAAGELLLRINPGAGFGTGTHETTQLCLRAIGEAHQKSSLKDQGVLDFGSGSGILAIGAALLGAHVEAVEIDPLAIENARENAELNGVGTQVRFSDVLPPKGGPDLSRLLVIANILRPVLIEFAAELAGRLREGGTLILSGLIESDVAEVVACYRELLPDTPHEVRALNEWRAVIFRK